MHKEDNELTLGQLFKVVKKSFKRAIIYVLVTVIFVTAILFTARVFTNTNVYTARITFATADKATGTKMATNKQTVLSKVLAKDEKLADAENLSKGLTVTPYIPEQDEEDTTEYIPTTFDITLKTSSKVDYTSDEYKAILKSVAEEYVNIFSLASFPATLTEYSVPGKDDSTEYFQIADELLDNANLFYNTLSSYVSDYPELVDYKSTEGKNVQTLLNQTSNVISKLENMQLYVINNGYAKNLDNLKATVNSLQAIANNNKTMAETNSVNAQIILNKFPQNITITAENNPENVGIQETYVAYLNAVKEYNKYLSDAALYTTKANTLNEYFTTVNSKTEATPDEVKASLQGNLETLNKTLNDISKSYKLLAEEYNANKYLTSDAQFSGSVKSVSDGPINTLVFIIINVLFALMAYIVAYAQVYGKMKKNGTLYEDSAENTKAENE